MKSETETAVKEELLTLERLKADLSPVLANDIARPAGVHDNVVQDGLARIRNARLQAERELLRLAYGRVFKTTEINENDRILGAPTFRITQANVSHLACNIIARNSPVASQLLIAGEDGTADVSLPRGDWRYFRILETRDLYGASGLSRQAEPVDVARGEFTIGRGKPEVVVGFRKSVAFLSQKERAAPVGISKEPQRVSPKVSIAPPAPPKPRDLPANSIPGLKVWPDNWSQIELAPDDGFSLSGGFFVRTTPDQERTLAQPKGIVVVQGIAGSGKTSVALGRVKFLANFATGEHLDDYALRAIPASAFDPANMIGFVLAPSLVGYLEGTCKALDIAQLPVMDFPAYLRQLQTQFKLGPYFRKSSTPGRKNAGTMKWLRLIDAAIGQEIVARIAQFLRRYKSNEDRDRVAQHFRALTKHLSLEAIGNGRMPLRIEGIAEKLASCFENAVVEDKLIEFERQTNVFGEAFKQLERRRIDREYRGKLSNYVKSFLSEVHPIKMYRAIIEGDHFRRLVGTLPTNEQADYLALCKEFSEGQIDAQKPTLSHYHLVAVLSLTAAMAAEFRTLPADTLPLPFKDIATYSGVFIDEMQDFAETELHLMSRRADRVLNQITAVGDFGQQLTEAGKPNLAECFPHIPATVPLRAVELLENMRQKGDLRTLSAVLRRGLLRDDSVRLPAEYLQYRQPLSTWQSKSEAATQIAAMIETVPREASIAVICTREDQEEWASLLAAALEPANWEVLASTREDVLARHVVHVTRPVDVKGLEFDAVIIPDVEALARGPAGSGSVYVAASRARYALFMGAPAGRALDAPFTVVPVIRNADRAAG